MHEARTGRRWSGLVLAAGGFALAALGSGRPGFWNDEAASISAASRPTGDLVDLLGRIDLVHSQFYVLLHLWGNVFGWSEIATRLPSAICVGLSTYLVFDLTRRLFGARAAVPAAVLFAVLPGVASSGLEARGFALTTTLFLVASGVLDRAAARSSTRWWLLYAVLLALAIWGEVYVLIALPGHLLLAVHRHDLRRWLWAAGATVLVASPFVLATVHQSAQLPVRVGFGLADLPGTLLHSTPFVGPRDPASTIPLQGPASYVLMLLVLALAGLAIHGHRRDRPLLTALVVWAFIPPLVVYVASLPDGSMYASRYFVFTMPGLAILGGAGLARLQRGWLRVAVLGVIVLSALPMLVAARQPTSKSGHDYAAVAAAVTELSAAGERPQRVAFSSPTARGVAVVHPDRFTGLQDISLARSPIDDASLWGTNASADATARGAAGHVVIVVRVSTEGDDPTSQALRRLGCTVEKSWSSVMLSVDRVDCTRA